MFVNYNPELYLLTLFLFKVITLDMHFAADLTIQIHNK